VEQRRSKRRGQIVSKAKERDRSGEKSFSLYYNDLARWLFITLAFAGLLSTGWFGIPLIPKYLLYHSIDLPSALFTLFSALGTIWGVMAYREFTKSANTVLEARYLARKLDPSIGDYEYRSYNPMTKLYENGFVPIGPTDFWDRETQTPIWMDKGKYWHILLRLQQNAKNEVLVKVVRDRDLPLHTGRRNIATTSRERIFVEGTRKQGPYTYIVKIPQWLVMNTERARFVDTKERMNIDDTELSAAISDLNAKMVSAADEVIERESPRIRFHLKSAAFWIYLNKSLPLRLIYREAIKHIPGVKEDIIGYTSANLAIVRDDELASSIIEIALQRGLPQERIENLQLLMKFLKNEYTKQGIGEGASEYHSFHHSLEVSYMALHMLPREFRSFTFGPKDYEIILVAGLLHDYDPYQNLALQSGSDKAATDDRGVKVVGKNEESGQVEKGGDGEGEGKGSKNPAATKVKRPVQKGPNVIRTVDEIRRTRILDAYFTMTKDEFQNYFRYFRSVLLPPEEFATTHPEYVKQEWSPTESLIVEALVWRTDFPFFKQKIAQERFARLLLQLTSLGYDSDKLKLLAEVLWLSDLAVTYMGSDPIRAWNRVNNLYDELYLPKLEAVSRTDAFFTDFAEPNPQLSVPELFKELINSKQFPEVFRARWAVVYQFFHEGNPATQINKTITKARKLYSKVNLEIGMRRGELLQRIAADNWSEYFIGIGKDQSEILKAKSNFAKLAPQNASAFWGDFEKLLPNIMDGSIDNFLMVVPMQYSPSTDEEKTKFQSLFVLMQKKLAKEGALHLLTDMKKDAPELDALVAIALAAGFEQSRETKKVYFPRDWKDQDFSSWNRPEMLVFRPRGSKLK